VDDNYKLVTWKKDDTKIANIRDECAFTSVPDNTYNYTCDVDNKMYYLIIPPDAITDGIQDSNWQCLPYVETGSSEWSLKLSGTYSV
jgi:hypothetical protein